MCIIVKALDKAPWDVKDGKLISSWQEENINLYAMDWQREEKEHRGVYRFQERVLGYSCQMFMCLGLMLRFFYDVYVMEPIKGSISCSKIR